MLTKEVKTQIAGLTVVIDVQGFSFKHIRYQLFLYFPLKGCNFSENMYDLNVLSKIQCVVGFASTVSHSNLS